MTDTEIIKALECCSNSCDDGFAKCDECPRFEEGSGCTLRTMKDAFDLINRQQAEIERYEQLIPNKYCICTKVGNGLIYSETTEDYDKIISEISAEAIKEFADKVILKIENSRRKYQRLCKEQGEKEDEVMNIHYRGIINLVKEMVGEKDV